MEEWVSGRGNIGVVIDAPLVLIVASAHGISDPEWEEFLDINPSTSKVQAAIQLTASLSYIPSVGLSAKQRKRLTERMHPSRVVPFNAVVTDSSVVRGSITALSWVLRKFSFQAFPCAEVFDALGWLATKEPSIDVPKARLALRALLRKIDTGVSSLIRG